MRKALAQLGITAGAAAAWLALGHIGLLAILVYVWATAMMATTSTAKARDTENRVDSLSAAAGKVAGRVNGLSGQNTSNAGLPDGTIGGHTDTAGLADGTIGGSTGQINTGGGTAHTHGPGSLSVNNGRHEHGANASDGNLAVNNGNHNHSLPNV
jgi:hypothetical protein